MNANFGLMAPLNAKIRDKRQRDLVIAERALARIDQIEKTL
jgi:folate-dependent tRNA-U54 methylase TrmFO/GidA